MNRYTRKKKPHAFIGAAIGLASKGVGAIVGKVKKDKADKMAGEADDLRMQQDQIMQDNADQQYSQSILAQYNPMGQNQEYFNHGGMNDGMGMGAAHPMGRVGFEGGGFTPYPYQDQPSMANITIAK